MKFDCCYQQVRMTPKVNTHVLVVGFRKTQTKRKVMEKGFVFSGQTQRLFFLAQTQQASTQTQRFSFGKQQTRYAEVKFKQI